MFKYFQDNYSWHTHFHMALLRGGNLSEIDDYCRHLQELSGRRDQVADEAWFVSWSSLGDHVSNLAARDEESGFLLTAGRKYQRASVYYFTAEKMLTNLDPRKTETYDKALNTFWKGIRFRQEAVEQVEVPFRHTSLPALFVPAAYDGRARCMVHFNGYDGVKEIVYQRMGDEFRRRGTSLLLVDQPGTGEALRRRDIRFELHTEESGAACVDYLQGRPDVDAQRIGVMGVSLGSYHAGRAAAFEKRFQCCVSWGGYWSPNEVLESRTLDDRKVESVPPFHRRWITGTDTDEEAAEMTSKITLEGISDQITCPLLVVYGENDALRPRWMAEKQVSAAINSPKRELKVFTASEGGSEHCQNDNNTLGLDYIADWVSLTLGGEPKGI